MAEETIQIGADAGSSEDEADSSTTLPSPQEDRSFAGTEKVTLAEEMAVEAAPAQETTTEEAVAEEAAVPAEPFALAPRPIPAPPPEPKRPSAAKEEASQSPFSVTVGQVYDGPFDLLLD